jgi:hypothetical protein
MNAYSISQSRDIRYLGKTSDNRNKYKDRPITTQAKRAQIKRDKPLTKFQSLRRALEVTEENEEEDELKKFLNTTPYTIHCSPLEWWTREEQRIEYPRLHHMAIDTLSIPPPRMILSVYSLVCGEQQHGHVGHCIWILWRYKNASAIG